MADTKHTTPVDTPVLPGGHRMGSMHEPMAAQPAIEKDTPIPSDTPLALQQGGELQGKSVPTPEQRREAAPTLAALADMEVPPHPEAAKAGKTQPDAKPEPNRPARDVAHAAKPRKRVQAPKPAKH